MNFSHFSVYVLFATTQLFIITGSKAWSETDVSEDCPELKELVELSCDDSQATHWFKSFVGQFEVNDAEVYIANAGCYGCGGHLPDRKLRCQYEAAETNWELNYRAKKNPEDYDSQFTDDNSLEKSFTSVEAISKYFTERFPNDKPATPYAPSLEIVFDLGDILKFRKNKFAESIELKTGFGWYNSKGNEVTFAVDLTSYQAGFENLAVYGQSCQLNKELETILGK